LRVEPEAAAGFKRRRRNIREFDVLPGMRPS